MGLLDSHCLEFTAGIKRLLDRRSISQAELARRALGVNSASNITKYMSGRVALSPDMKAKLAGALGLVPNDITMPKMGLHTLRTRVNDQTRFTEVELFAVLSTAQAESLMEFLRSMNLKDWQACQSTTNPNPAP